MTHEDAYLARMAGLLNHGPILHAAGCFLLLLWVGECLWREGKIM